MHPIISWETTNWDFEVMVPPLAPKWSYMWTRRFSRSCWNVIEEFNTVQCWEIRQGSRSGGRKTASEQSGRVCLRQLHGLWFSWRVWTLWEFEEDGNHRSTQKWHYINEAWMKQLSKDWPVCDLDLFVTSLMPGCLDVTSVPVPYYIV